MKGQIFIQAKAFLLIVIFSMNTIMGFACAVGIDMGYNAHHHCRGMKAPPDPHIDHCGKRVARHDQPTGSSNDDCCSHGVTAFTLLSKSLPGTFQFVPVVSPAAHTSFFLFVSAACAQHLEPVYFSPAVYHPPGQQLRISIQSFLI